MTSKSINDGNPTCIYREQNGFLVLNPYGQGFGGAEGETLPLATVEDYKAADKTPGSIFEALEPGENVRLQDGYFVLDDDLDLVQDWQIV